MSSHTFWAWSRLGTLPPPNPQNWSPAFAHFLMASMPCSAGPPVFFLFFFLLPLGNVLAHFLQQAPVEGSGGSPLKRWQWIAVTALDGYTPRHKPISPTFPRLPFLILSLSYFLFFSVFQFFLSDLATQKRNRKKEQKNKEELNSQTTRRTKEKKKDCTANRLDIGLAYFYICRLHSLVLCLFFFYSSASLQYHLHAILELHSAFCARYLSQSCPIPSSPVQSCPVSRRTCPGLVLAGPYPFPYLAYFVLLFGPRVSSRRVFRLFFFKPLSSHLLFLSPNKSSPSSFHSPSHPLQSTQRRKQTQEE